MSKIEIKNIYKIFGTDPLSVLPMVQKGASKEQVLEETGHTVGLDNVSISIEEGETFVCMGLSGSGKSTLIRHINRLIDPTHGEVIVNGTNVLDLNENQLIDFRKNEMSMVFQRFGLFPHKTVIQNVAYGLEIQGMQLEKRNEIAMKQIEAVGLIGFENQYPSQLSGGMQQRVGLARALATNPGILLMDEAFSALDPLIRSDMQQQLIELQSELKKTAKTRMIKADQFNAKDLKLSDTYKVNESVYIEEFLPKVLSDRSTIVVVDNKGDTMGYITEKELAISLSKTAHQK